MCKFREICTYSFVGRNSSYWALVFLLWWFAQYLFSGKRGDNKKGELFRYKKYIPFCPSIKVLLILYFKIIY